MQLKSVNASIKAIQENVLKLEPQPGILLLMETPFIHKNGITSKD
jgi:hypothetical protein